MGGERDIAVGVVCAGWDELGVSCSVGGGGDIVLGRVSCTVIVVVSTAGGIVFSGVVYVVCVALRDRGDIDSDG